MIPLARPLIGDEERQAVDDVLRSGMIAQGPEVASFESEFGLHVADRHCVAVNSGTSALHLALLALGIGPGDEVIVPSFTFAATGNSVALTGATPVFADIELETYCLDPDAAQAAITERTAAIMPVHLYGHPAQMGRLRELADKHSLALIEDAAQAHLAAIDGRPVGAWGDIAGFSFYPTKNMTTGEGGMVTTSDPQLARRVQLLRNQGMEQRYLNELVGLNNRMTDIQAAIGRVQLTRLPDWTKARQRNAEFLTDHLEGVGTPVIRDGYEHVFHQYTIRVEQGRDSLVTALQDMGVGCAVYYPTPTHELPSFGLSLDLPNTRTAAQQVLSLPVHPSLTEAELETIATSVNKAVEELSA
ncbi:MAG: DegT/DnrJ/EryC1/StrS family aminotransferase [Actinobacteria bacterium]|nr:DegT/DnrJ/EryC1/StrS family aminotransferase [Actinomycetota bacterium]